MKYQITTNPRVVYESLRVRNTDRIAYIRLNGQYYVAVVRSLSSTNLCYVVHISIDGRKVYCTCNYHLITGKPCKHILAVMSELKRKGLLDVEFRFSRMVGRNLLQHKRGSQ